MNNETLMSSLMFKWKSRLVSGAVRGAEEANGGKFTVLAEGVFVSKSL